MENTGANYLASAHKQFKYYQSLGDKVINLLNENQLHWQYNAQSNSVAMIIKHIAGNSISRWTDFLTTDGEKPGRNRDEEFEGDTYSKAQLLTLWIKGWECLYTAIDQLTAEDLIYTIYIRGEKHTVTEAINRQLAHFPYHIGQMVYIARMILGEQWESLSIAKGQSKQFNDLRFSTEHRKINDDH